MQDYISNIKVVNYNVSTTVSYLVYLKNGRLTNFTLINEKLTTKYIASFTNRLPIEILLSVGQLNTKIYIKNGKEIYIK